MNKARLLVFAVAATSVPLSALAQPGRPVETMLKTPPRADEARVVNANLPELVNLRVSQLEEDLNLTPAQLPLWNAYRARVQSMLDDVRRGARASASETNAPNRLDALADGARNRLTAVEDIVDAGKALYAVLTPQQKEVADRRLALPLATLTGNDGGAGSAMNSPRK